MNYLSYKLLGISNLINLSWVNYKKVFEMQRFLSVNDSLTLFSGISKEILDKTTIQISSVRREDKLPLN